MNATWTVRIERLATELPVGIYDNEREPQPVWVSLTATGEANAVPGTLDECFDYEPLCNWLTQEWPKSPHTPLLETRVNQVIGFVFAADARIHQVWVGLYKQRVSHQAHAVGMERSSTRAEFEVLRCKELDPSSSNSSLSDHGDTHAELST